jgi:hypothetical protein
VSRRPPSPPPDLPGYSVTRLLGSGGFADVYLYAQALPRRNVAIKVLIPGAADEGMLAQFNAEANLMAALSTHPAIVTIYQAGIAGDGRPYLVMEYCSRPNLSVRYRAERLSVAEVLSIGVRIAGAVETAHRAGILHRDIKPANVLTTDFGHPVLSDFGISVSRGSSAMPGGAIGMSIPWTAPEMFAARSDAAGTGDERSDIYSLAATVYTVLARRSPFDRPGGPNGTADLIGRIRTTPVPPLGRSDVPPALERVLARAMDKNPAARHASALDFARAQQRVETELRLAVTPVDVLAEEPAAITRQQQGGMATRVRSLTVVDPAAEPDALGHAGPGHAGPGRLGSVSVVATHGGPADAVVPAPAGHPTRNPRTTGPDPGPPAADVDTAPRGGRPSPGRRSRLPILVGGGFLLVAAALIAALLLTRGGQTPPPPDNGGDHLTTASTAGDPLGAAVPQPAGLTGRRTGDAVVFHWTNPQPKDGDSFQWYRTDQGVSPERHVTRQPVATVRAPGRVCIAVILVRGDGTSSPEPARACGTSSGPSTAGTS